ncbi:MAG: hypothetical protein LBS81_05010 [Endomicrobium sp.]|jgi:hypothetical protein|nr:hypothetical protein [Endomicrobium sp.]
MKRLLFILTSVFLFLTSCSTLDYPVRVLGFSVTKFENEKVGRFIKIFTMQKRDCFNKSLNIIKDLKARITHKNFNKGYIVAFDFSKSFNYCLDSTEAAVFITKIDNSNVKVEVVSNNSLLARMLSVKFFEMLKL